MNTSLYKELPYVIIPRTPNGIWVNNLNITKKSKLYYKGNVFPISNYPYPILGSCDSSVDDNFGIEILRDYTISFSHGSTYTNTEVKVTKSNNLIEAEFTGNGYVKINNQIYNNTTNATSFSRSDLLILGGYNGEDSQNTPQYVYRIKLYEDGATLSCDFIPCKRLSDNVVGLYDNVHNKFYGNEIVKEPDNIMSDIKAIQIPEGSVTKIEDEEGKILWANINKLAYGVRWNSVNQATTACERIGNPELHKTLPIQSRFKVCIHKGKEIQYYCHPDDSRFRENPTILSKDDFVFENCDGLPSGIVCCDENSEVTYKIINDIFADYKYLYAYIYIRSGENTSLARIVYVDTINKTAYINAHGLSKSTYADITAPLNLIVSTDADYSVELGTVLNGYDGEIGVDTGGKFYQWSVDNDGDSNEVWQSLYKCVPYAREIKRHIIGIDRACVLNTAFNDTKWGWIGSLEADTAVDVINYHTNLRGGGNTTTFDSYLGVDNFRCQFGKARTNLELATMRSYSQKTDGGQMLYKQIWEAIVWSYVIEYANFDVKKAYNAKLTTEGYHQGGLGSGVGGGQNLGNYNEYQKFVPNDYTLEFGNKTDIKIRANRQWDTPVAANNYWDSYYTSKVVATKSSDNKILTITSTKILTTNWNIYAAADKVGSVTRYKITGLTDDQTVVFKREKGNLTITTDGTYDVEWGTGDNQRNIYFGKLQTDCNIVIEIISAPAYNIIQNQNSWNVPHWRGFNVFWYGDISINIDNMLNKNNYDTDKDEKIWYYTDDISKFDDTIDNKEHQIKGLGKANNDWLKEVRINDKGDIVPSKLYYNGDYKNSYHHNDNYDSINCTVVGGYCIYYNYNGLLFLSTDNSIYVPSIHIGFVKVTILDN